MKLDARFPGGRTHTIEIETGRGETKILLDGQCVSVRFQKLNESRCLVDLGGNMVDALVYGHGAEYTVILDGRSYRMELFDRRLKHAAQGDFSDGVQSVKAQMPGRVVKLLKSAGDSVDKDAAVLVIEAMKMQNEIRCPRSGVICQIAAKEGESVTTGQLLFEVS